MQYAHLNLRVPVKFKERLNDHRVETGIPNSVFVRRLVEAALNERQQTKAKPRRRAAG